MRLLSYPTIAVLFCAPLLHSAEKSKVAERLDDSAALFSEVMSAPDKSIPQDLLNKAACIVLVPGMKKGAFVVGAQYGRGFGLCRGAGGQGWGPPAAIRMEGGSFGLQAGVSSTDVILLIMNERGMRRLTSDKFTIGADAAAAGGPVGRNASAMTDAMMTAEILSWSRSRGAFVGVSLDGATLRGDTDENEAMYGKRWTSKQIIGSGATPPPAAAKLLDLLTKYSMRKTN
jgi:lipid-binding SYLF domain-containing protein